MQSIEFIHFVSRIYYSLLIIIFSSFLLITELRLLAWCMAAQQDHTPTRCGQVSKFWSMGCGQ